MKYKIWWVGLLGNSGYIEPDEYTNKKTAQDDADKYNKAHPGITHYVEKIEDD
jgi:hypothetical protein